MLPKIENVIELSRKNNQKFRAEILQNICHNISKAIEESAANGYFSAVTKLTKASFEDNKDIQTAIEGAGYLWQFDEKGLLNIFWDLPEDEEKEDAKEWFGNLLSQMRLDFTRPNLILFFIDEELLLEQDSKNNHMWVSYTKIWSILEREYNMKYTDIQIFIKTMAEEHFKVKLSAPSTRT